MSRYAYHGQEVLKRNGKLVGFNAGYGFYAEHEVKYSGAEQIKPKKFRDKNKDNPFNGEIIEKERLHGRSCGRQARYEEKPPLRL